MTPATAQSPQSLQSSLTDPVATEVRRGLMSDPRTLAPWLFYDERGSELFEDITALAEYYPTRTERSIFSANAAGIIHSAASGERLTLLELGAGTATKTGILLREAVRQQGSVLYQPVDVSSTALDEATRNLAASIPGIAVHPQVANYITDPLSFARPGNSRALALYIGSSIGNFSPSEATGLLQNLRCQLRPGDSLLLGTDLAPGPHKSIATLVAAYDDAAGVTAAFNRNILTRINRDLGADFNPSCFAHQALWNPQHSRIEMHLSPVATQHVHIPANNAGPALDLIFSPGRTIHTENSYKFTSASVDQLLSSAGFAITRAWRDPHELFAVTLAAAS